MNEYGQPNNTNLHTHGLHVPHEEPGDNVFINVYPETVYNYTYDIPVDHAPGTYWYHPHLHGSTALHTGGGAHGLLIVEDDGAADGLPSYLHDGSVEEMDLVISVIPQREDGPDSLDAIEAASGGNVIATSGPATLVLLNGQNKPVISMEANRWYRWRMVLASVRHYGNFIVEGCEIGVLAKDGVYLLDGPRPASYLFMVSGSRVDALIKYPSELIGRSDVTLQASTTAGIRVGGGGGGGDGGGGGAADVGNREIATISVVQGTDAPGDSMNLASMSFTPNMPSYLQDLRGRAIHGSKEIELDGGGGCTINGLAWQGVDGEGLFSVFPGTFEEFTIDGGDHPLHLHVNPLQVRDGINDWYRSGDWHDVVIGQGTFRMHVADHTGTVVCHCHWLSHEDQGCMAKFTINECATDDITAGIVGTCSTHEALGLSTVAITLIIAAPLLVLCCAYYIFSRTKTKDPKCTPQKNISLSKIRG